MDHLVRAHGFRIGVFGRGVGEDRRVRAERMGEEDSKVAWA